MGFGWPKLGITQKYLQNVRHIQKGAEHGKEVVRRGKKIKHKKQVIKKKLKMSDRVFSSNI